MFDAVSSLGDRTIAYKPVIRAAGIASTTNGTLLASQLLWLYQQAGRQPFAVTDLELSAQIGLTVREIRNARADLVKRLGDQSYFRHEVRGWERSGWYDVDSARMNAITQKPSDDAQTTNGANGRTQSGNPKDQPVECKRPASHFQTTNGANASDQPVVSSIYKTLLEDKNLEEEPPLSPAAIGVTDQGLELDTGGTTAQGGSSDPQRPFRPRESDIPELLLPVASELLDFWVSKGGKKTQPAWIRLVNQLKLIQADVAGGTEVVREQLDAGVQVGWQGLTYKNWQRYSRQGAVSLPNGSSRRTSTSITHDGLQQAIAYCEAQGYE
jgi:hypothetical protein